MRALFLLLLTAAIAGAAPIPKSVTKPPSPEGVWELVELNLYGKPRPVGQHRYWQVKDGKLSVGVKSVEDLKTADFRDLHFVDPGKSSSVDLVITTNGKPIAHHSLLEVEPNEMRFCWPTSNRLTPKACEPGDGVYYYVFKRVK